MKHILGLIVILILSPATFAKEIEGAGLVLMEMIRNPHGNKTFETDFDCSYFGEDSRASIKFTHTDTAAEVYVLTGDGFTCEKMSETSFLKRYPQTREYINEARSKIRSQGPLAKNQYVELFLNKNLVPKKKNKIARLFSIEAQAAGSRRAVLQILEIDAGQIRLITQEELHPQGNR